MMSSGSANGSTRRWRNLRAAKLRAAPACELCGNADAVEVDHIEPLSEGGDRWAWGNLRSVCDDCHKIRHGKRPRTRYDAAGFPIWRGA